MCKGLIATACAVMLVMAGGLLWNANASTMGVPSLPNFSPVHTVGCGGPGRCPWGSRWVCGPYGRCGCVACGGYIAARAYVAPGVYVALGLTSMGLTGVGGKKPTQQRSDPV